MGGDRLLQFTARAASMLFRADHWSDVAGELLEELGRATGATRAHLFQGYDTGSGELHFRQIGDWAVAPEWSERELAELQDFTLGEFFLTADPVGQPGLGQVIEARDLPEPHRSRWQRRGITTSLAAALWVGGRHWGTIGLDYCEGERSWSHGDRMALCTVADILGVAIERELATEASRANDRQRRVLQRAVEQSPVSIVITDIEGRIVYVNARFVAVSGYTVEEALGQYPSLLKSGLQPPEFYHDLWRTITTGSEWTGELQNRRKDGSIFWERVSISPLVDESGQVEHYIAVKEDVTHQRALEAQLRHAQKMEALGQVAGGVAHDFNNVLAAIDGAASMLAEELPAHSEARELVDEIRSAVNRSSVLTRQLLAVGRRQPFRLQDTSLNAVVRDFERMLARVLGSSVTLALELTGDDVVVRADAGQLEQMLLNLVVNARDAMPRGGVVTIRTRLEAPQALRPGQAARPAACVEVADQGEGIPPEDRERVFEPFYSTKDPEHGSGLGLATVFSIVEQLGGRIEVQSDVGAGTCFSIRLPAVR